MSGSSVAPPRSASGPLDGLPRLARRQAMLEARLARVGFDSGPRMALAWLVQALGADLRFGQPEILWKATGLTRPGLVARLAWPRLSTRLGLGIEPSLIHAVVDRLLGFTRFDGEGRLQVTPVERGIVAFILAETLARLAERPGALGPWDLVLDRVAGEAFDPDGLGELVTLRWPVLVGSVSGSARLWIPEAILARWLASGPAPGTVAPSLDRYGSLVSRWRAEVEAVTLPRGAPNPRVGLVLPLSGLRGTPRSPSGRIELTASDADGRCVFPAEPIPDSAGAGLRLTGPLTREPMPREPIPVPTPPEPTPTPAPPAGTPPVDVPVTLVVELGRINIPLRRLADLRPGDVVELGRHAREPVELTSGGRLVARGELVQVDTELGVRITSLFL